jgi:hypothetical protein
VLRDRDLLKFVFSKPPTDVRRVLNAFQREVERALLLPVSLNIYDTQFYAKEDGSLDFSSTRFVSSFCTYTFLLQFNIFDLCMLNAV